MKSNTKNRDLKISFDVGHSSIGWAVVQPDPNVASTNPNSPLGGVDILGCGSVIFRADDCLASTRRSYRRQRRHIRSTRQRIARLKLLLSHLGVLTPAQLDKPGCAWPWQLAARVLKAGPLLSWPELWDVLRWYAHNRGYDANRRWSAAESEAEKEDSEKIQNAHNLMSKYNAQTMAETFCAAMGLDPLGSKKSSMERFKRHNAAFPRNIVEKELRRILQAHQNKLPSVDSRLEEALFDNWQAISIPSFKLPKRYQGGLLFGQLVPRFDNRIISKCPITGEKVPSKNRPEFLSFRWAMQLANIRVAHKPSEELRPLNINERKGIDAEMRQQGALTQIQLKNLVREKMGCVRDNLDTMLMHPDAKEALLLDPVAKLLHSDRLEPFWPFLPSRIQKRAIGKWRRGKMLTLAQFRQQMIEIGESTKLFDLEVQRFLDGTNTRKRKKGMAVSAKEILNHPLKVEKLQGRAAFARSLLVKAHQEVMAGKHPKEEGGCLFLSEKIRQQQLNREIAEQTNNHLVRHRLLMLERLLKDIISEYAQGDKNRIASLTIEVNRDLQAMSGKTAKEKEMDLRSRIANHHAVSAALEKALEGTNHSITASLIRKARIADDLGWTCPYTGQQFEPIDLVTRRVDKDHVIPRSQRPADSLDSLVITYAAVNAMKGNRTAYQFVEQEQGKPISDLPNLSIVSLTRYKKFVESLEAFKGHDDDKRRKKNRKEFMLLPRYEAKEFVPRDLTQTSFLVRLGAQIVKRFFHDCDNPPAVASLPGSVTAQVRKSWNLLGSLSLACPQVLDENGLTKTKTEIRDITHLHHALDACVLGLAAHFIPNNGRVWELLLKRQHNPAERKELSSIGCFSFDSEGRLHLRELSDSIKNQFRNRLAERRVVQHIPARISGLRVEQNTWRVVGEKDGQIVLRQRVRKPDGTRPVKEVTEKPSKLLGLNPRGGRGKLRTLKGVLVIPENFGLVLEPTPAILPFHKVWTKLRELKQLNHGKIPSIIRLGQLIEVPKGRYKGMWKLFSIKNNTGGIAVRIGHPDAVEVKDATQGVNNALVATLLKDGMRIAKTPLTGVAACPTTSSA